VVETKQIKGKYLSDHVLYPSGGKIYGNNLYLYLGAGDSEIRRTKLNLDAIMQWATQYDAEGKLKGV
jgi:hypothetical protein